MRAGSARIVGDGAGFVCRIHVEDLARLSLACLERRLRSETFVVADDEPAPQGEVVTYLAGLMGLPVPAAVPLAEAPETLRHDRRVDASGIKRRLALDLRYPTYRTGFPACLAVEAGQQPAS
jgi:nucleoside-diphosphate-sugar epimerase